MKTCDLCDKHLETRANLYDVREFNHEPVKHVCEACWREIHILMDKIDRFAWAMRDSVVTRWIERKKLKLSGWEGWHGGRLEK